MKRLIAYTVALLCSAIGVAQDIGSADKKIAAPVQAIPALEDQQKTRKEYTTAELYWEDQVELDTRNENAWLNLYKAARYSNFTYQSRAISAAGQQELNDILSRMNNILPNSFAWNYCSYLNSNRNDASIPYLKKAFELRPDVTELWDDMLCTAVIEGDANAILHFSRQLNDAYVYSNTEMEYNRNVLSSVEKDGVLITNGNVDTYPLIVLQQVYGYRADVKIICLDWYGSTKYVGSISQLFNMKPERNKPGDPYGALKNILASAEGHNLYFSLTIPPDILSGHRKELYCTGLAMKFSTKPLQNLTSLQYNWENLFQKTSLGTSEHINRNYLLPLLLLKELYVEQGNQPGADEMKLLAEQIAQRFGVKEQISKKLE